jgi:hypothetical protein
MQQQLADPIQGSKMKWLAWFGTQQATATIKKPPTRRTKSL